MKTREQKISQVTIVGSAVNALLTIGKIIAGVVGHSGAMLADGLHSLSDFISDIIVLVCVRISTKGRDDDHDYGHGKYETLATLCVGALLLIVHFSQRSAIPLHCKSRQGSFQPCRYS